MERKGRDIWPQTRSPGGTKKGVGSQLLQQYRIRISMDGRVAWRDNVFVERLWKSIKYEEVYLPACMSVSKDKAGIGRYGSSYNFRSPNWPLDRQTPDTVYFEILPLAAAA